jgi:rRNA processing protein Gar1
MSTKVLLGNVKHQSKGNKNLIITLQAEARIGQSVFDKTGKPIGKIFDIFGPVMTPYASIKLNADTKLVKVEGKPLFHSLSTFKKKKRRKKGHRSR